MSMLSDDDIDWKSTRLLELEFSVARCRKLGLGWRPLTYALQTLEKKGFTHVYGPTVAPWNHSLKGSPKIKTESIA